LAGSGGSSAESAPWDHVRRGRLIPADHFHCIGGTTRITSA
jgi:hypothetical protein